jgi:hypothetical protein
MMLSKQRASLQGHAEYQDTGSRLNESQTDNSFRHEYRVFVLKNGVHQPIVYTDDEWAARHVADTREPGVASYVMDARGNVVHRNASYINSSVDMG